MCAPGTCLQQCASSMAMRASRPALYCRRGAGHCACQPLLTQATSPKSVQGRCCTLCLQPSMQAGNPSCNAPTPPMCTHQLLQPGQEALGVYYLLRGAVQQAQLCTQAGGGHVAAAPRACRRPQPMLPANRRWVDQKRRDGTTALQCKATAALQPQTLPGMTTPSPPVPTSRPPQRRT